MFLKLKKIGNIKLLTIFYICYNFRLYSVLAVIYFAQITHSYALALSLFSIAQISQAIFEIPFGYYSDKFGRVRCLQAGAVASLLMIIFYAIGQNYLMLLFGAIFSGINNASFSGNNDALLYESLVESERKEDFHHEFGKMNSWLELSGFISLVIGSLIAIKSLSLLFILSIVPQVIALVLSFGFVEPYVKKEHFDSMVLHLKDSLLTYKTNFKVRLLSLADIIGSAGGVSWSFLSVFNNLFLPTWATSLVLSLNYLTSFISFRFSGRLIRRFDAIKVLFYQEVYSRVLTLIAFIFPSIASPFLLATASISYGPGVVAKSTILQNEFTNHQRATMASINSFVGNIVYSILAVIVGLAADKFGVARSLLVVQICMISITFIYYKLFKLSKLK